MGPIRRDVGDKMSSHEIVNVLRDERFASLESIVWADSELAPLVITPTQRDVGGSDVSYAFDERSAGG